MPSVRYYNASAPFWDFVAEMESRATNNNNQNNNAEEEGNENENEHPNPWAGAWGGAPWGAFPFRGRRHGGPPHHHHHGPPPPPPADGETDPEEGPSTERGPPPPFTEKPDEEHHARGHHGPHRRCGRGGPRGRGGFGGWGGRGGGGGGGAGWGRGGHFHPYMHPLIDMFQSQLFGGAEESNTSNEDRGDETFNPSIDVFDTPTSFVIHVSLPGAKKDDVGVNWDAEKSELSVGGVVYRPGDEEFLKTLALDERQVGAFERKVRLGSRANPAQVDVEGIVARMEDGVLTVEVPKVGSEGFVEVRKVDIE